MKTCDWSDIDIDISYNPKVSDIKVGQVNTLSGKETRITTYKGWVEETRKMSCLLKKYFFKNNTNRFKMTNNYDKT